MLLYYRPTCPYCIKVRAYAEENGIVFELKNIIDDPDVANELTARGGKRQVPFLVCDCGVEMYESDDIIAHLQKCLA